MRTASAFLLAFMAAILAPLVLDLGARLALTGPLGVALFTATATVAVLWTLWAALSDPLESGA